MLRPRYCVKLDHMLKLKYNYFKSIKPYIVIVVAYGKIIPEKYLSLSEKGFLNIHASLLPKWRGAAPIQRSIMNRDKETGVSFMMIEKGLDVGPYVNQIKVKIDSQTTAGSLTDELSKVGADNILKTIDLIENNKINFTTQDNSKASYAKKISKTETKIVWKDKAVNIIAKIDSGCSGHFFTYKDALLLSNVQPAIGPTGILPDKSRVTSELKGSLPVHGLSNEGS